MDADVMARISKILMVSAIAFYVSLVVFGNITDPNTNYVAVQHVLSMDTVLLETTIKYRAITSLEMQKLFFILIVCSEACIAILCWIGAFRMLTKLLAGAAHFNASKKMAIAGLTLGVLTWQVGFISIGGDWFGMWMSKEWNSSNDAFQIVVTILLALIYVSHKDENCNFHE